MKTYNQFITELNKVELAMKAGKLGVKALRRLRLKPSSIMSPNKKVPVYDILKLRNSPRSPIVSKRKQIENLMKASKEPADIRYTNKGYMGLLRSEKGSSRFTGTELDTAIRQKELRGRSKAVVRADQKKRDAKIAIEDHIIECINQNYSQIRIVHGHGTGVLKKITEEVLSSSKFVKDFYPDHTFGVTIGNLIY